MKKYDIFFTGGGSGGHVMPALTLIQNLRKHQEYSIQYIGGVGAKSIERELIRPININYHGIKNGKLRRYFSYENFKDIIRVFIGIIQALKILLPYRAKQTLIFSTGGFVAVPVVFAAWCTRKKIFIHEQTTRVGLANKICSYFADKVFVSFEESLAFFPKSKTICSGYPLRPECFTPQYSEVVYRNRVVHPEKCKRSIMFITGGGNGSFLINELIKKNLAWLKDEYFIVHQVGKDFIEEYKKYEDEHYLAADFINQGMIDLFKMSHVIISRAGAGTVCELMALHKKSIFIPLKIAQKNEQYYNAMAAHDKMGSVVIKEDDIPNLDLKKVLQSFESATLQNSKLESKDATEFLVSQIRQAFTPQEV